ncbi:hypothetical protein LCGC14_0912230 [marine sediment metagenome]|uniref:Uncharacterized protein n=1 Tax=marine sediment metagenome TaxID=412755 RepID=A0A0F9RC71_9ZZZZ
MKITIPSGETITGKEYLSRWKQGIQKVGILHQTKIQVRSTWIIIIGILAGLVISAINFKTLWWLFIILCGALGNTSVQLISLIQKKNLLDSLEGGGE